MQVEKENLKELKKKLLEDAKNKYQEARPDGTDSKVGENLDKYMSSPRQSQPLKIIKSRSGSPTTKKEDRLEESGTLRKPSIDDDSLVRQKSRKLDDDCDSVDIDVNDIGL